MRNARVGMGCLIGLLVLLGVCRRAVAPHGAHLTPQLPRADTEAQTTTGGTSVATALSRPVSELLEIYECTRCHRLDSPYRLIGPSLWKIGERVDAAFIRASILTPDTVVAPGYPAGLMRARLQELGFYEDIARQPDILERLVAYLAGLKTPPEATDVPAPTEGIVHVQAGMGRLANGQMVAVPAFAIDAAPVSTARYALFIAAGGYTTKRYWERAGWAVVVQRRKRTHPKDWEAQSHQAPERPVTGVSWYEADAYCRWAGKALPTEVQWQRACLEVPGWYGPGEQAEAHWEWTAEAVWKGGKKDAENGPERCATRVASYPALDGPSTGFRCAAAVSHTVP